MPRHPASLIDPGLPQQAAGFGLTKGILHPLFRDRIFEPFFTYGKREDAGLGLTIARRIVEEHGGELWVESYQGEGATFVVALPV